MRCRKLFCLLFALLILFLLGGSVFANAPAGDSIGIVFDELPDEPCFITVLFEKEDNAYQWLPENEEWLRWFQANVPDPHYVCEDGVTERNLMEAFEGYSDPDGYLFVHHYQKLAANNHWSSVHNETFKILLYFPETDRFISSGVQQLYTKNSVYHASINGDQIVVTSDFRKQILPELLRFLLRLVLTVALELLIARLFGYRKKEAVRLILIVNVITQVLLNLVLFGIRLRTLFFVDEGILLLLELVIVVTEAVIYAKKLPDYDDFSGPVRAVIYAVVANLASLIAGLALWIISFVISP